MIKWNHEQLSYDEWKLCNFWLWRNANPNYKLEGWDAKGGDSTPKGKENRENQSSVQEGLVGYSLWILNLKENETIYA